MDIELKPGRTRTVAALVATFAGALSLLAAPAAFAQDAAAGSAAFAPRAAEPSPFAERTMILAAAHAGERIVTVGDRGVVLLSDDRGRTWRQSAGVPANAMLTAVSFADARHGWAVGHWGTILHTADGGETWRVQRVDTAEDRPLFSVHFSDPQNGIAVGLWALMLRTRDGGRSWEEVELPAPPGEARADANLMRIFQSPRGDLFIAGERGSVLRSTDGGETWSWHPTGYRGTFWSGTALDDGTLIVAGLRGSIYRSTDHGDSWQSTGGATRSSITDLAQLDDRVLAVGLDGVSLESRDRGRTFTALQREDRLGLTAVLAVDGKALVFSRNGVLPEE
ncbi:WD40/YVTN/BNR-like repeat-containing protein [Thauera aromatica]|uniref:BNR repeat protein n=1 Tax=Thauera aromatica K172 TaxID=44139 RepID=A0A2R4BRB7_THAAR|nr:YCF48-related protein [Thauera aromatica]AVR89879.1 BNR repeat protein [Thauera aromatica K172]